MRGFEKAFEDMLLQPELIHFIMDRVTTFFTEYFYEILKRCPGEIDMGIDVLQALQFSAANMDPAHLKDNHGTQLCFEGGMCVQKVLPFGSEEEVRQETRKLISILGKEGGYLCGPSHFIQAGTPAENIAAFFDQAMGYYPFR